MKKTLTFLLFFLSPFLNLCAQSDSAGAGYALKFTGTSGSYVSIGDNLNSLNFPFTVEAWVNLTGYPSIQGTIFSSDALDFYSGFWFMVRNNGHLFIEFGDNVGSGQQDRRGFETAGSLPLHKWVHVAAVCNSITDIQLYFNGVLQSAGPTDGFSGATAFFHDSGIGEIGNWKSLSGESPFLGQIDELRIWKTARTLNQIQQNMCSRVTSIPALVGYWRGFGSLKGTLVTDYASTPHNGTIVGGATITKVVSGAPVGDFSSTHYGSFTNRVITVTDISGDTFKVSAITGSPYGVSVYGVDHSPYRTKGLSIYPSHYFGVFCAENSITSTFKVTYHYSNGSIDGNSEPSARMFSKPSDSSITWITTGSKPDTASNIITKNGLATRGDFILNFIPTINVLTHQEAELQNIISIFPNPAHNDVTFSFNNTMEKVNVIRIFNLSGIETWQIKNPSSISSFNMNITNWNRGVYFAELITAKGNYYTHFIVQ